uniref:Modification methylase, HemK family protein n=1 Tax=Paulinella micropora TaxID=1928728 RepID=A0A385I0V9_9EUKA|nr:modification methylase, HemK family protein [Paulinella micropora]AXY63561.1 modification methylase, HemK family protein [Paulinella micropora]
MLKIIRQDEQPYAKNVFHSISISTFKAWYKARLYEGGIASDLDWLLSIILGFSWKRITFNQEHKLQLPGSLAYLTKLWQCHCLEHVPLQHLMGICPWRDLYLKVEPGTLIPRQETELLVDLALQCLSIDKAREQVLSTDHSDVLQWADLGTGSGAIAVALARALPHWIGHATDCSHQALIQAQNNLSQLVSCSRVTRYCGYWWEPLISLSGKINLILANPPYIPSQLIETLEENVVNHEPIIALDGGKDGLNAIRTLIDIAPKMLSPGGWIVIEHHYDQSSNVTDLMLNAGLTNIYRVLDLDSNYRFAIARKPLYQY